MLHRLLLSVIILSVAIASPLRSGAAQTNGIVGGDAAFLSRYVWRGLTRSSGWVLQPDLYLALQQRGVFVTIGWWGNVELSNSSIDNSNDIGLGKTWFGEDNLWVELSGMIGPADFSVGLVRYLFDDSNEAVRLNVFDTSEIYATLASELGALYPKLALWYDIDEVNGGYLEGSTDLRVPTVPLPYPIVTLYLGALAGVSLGQAIDPEDTDRRGYFADNGITHVDLYSRLQVGLTQIYVTLDAHFEIKVDELTKRTSGGPDGVDNSTQWWFGIALSASGP